jgi:hypothetical protein
MSMALSSQVDVNRTHASRQRNTAHPVLQGRWCYYQPVRWLLIALLCPLTAQAQPVAFESPSGTPDRTVEIRQDLLDVRAGPSPSYTSRGRLYLGDTAQVVDVSEDKRWIRVKAEGLDGWIPTSTVRALRGERSVDPGRDRRETNYEYDDQGRRRFLDGRAMGSGEGTQKPDRPATPTPESFWASPRQVSIGSPRRLAVDLRLGAAALHRAFASDIPADSALQVLSASPTALSWELAATYELHRYVQARGLFRDARFADSTVPANAAFGFSEPVTMAVDAQTAELDVVGRYPVVSGAWAGLYAGGRLFRQGFQRTAPYPLLLSHTFMGLGLGATAQYRLHPLTVAARGGLLVPFSVSQAPTEGGDAEASGWDLAGEVAWTLTRRWSVVAGAHYLKITTDFSGESIHVDNVVADPPVGYTAARARDRSMGGSLGVRWRP